MASTGIILDQNAIKYLCNCINAVSNISELIQDNATPSQTNTYSSYKISELLSELQTYVNNLIGNSSHLSKKIVDTAPTVEEADENTIYLVKNDEGGYEQYLLIDGAMVSLGNTNIVNNVYTKEESDSRYGLLTEVDSLIEKVGELTSLSTDDKTSIVNAINELKNSIVTIDDENVGAESTYSSSKITSLYPYPLEVTTISANVRDVQLTYQGEKMCTQAGNPNYRLYVIRIYGAGQNCTYGLCYWNGVNTFYNESFQAVDPTGDTSSGTDFIIYQKDQYIKIRLYSYQGQKYIRVDNTSTYSPTTISVQRIV